MRLPVPWISIEGDPAQRTELTNELRREMSAEHPLYDLPVSAIARRRDRDDVLYVIEDGSGRVAVVHLTWSRSAPEEAPFPWTELHADFEEWQAKLESGQT